MSLRRRFITAMVAFVVALAASGGFLAYWQARSAVEAEMDRRAGQIAQAAADAGFQSALAGIPAGAEDLSAWTAANARLRRLRSVVAEAYILAEDNTAIVSSLPVDSIAIGTVLPQFDLYEEEMTAAREGGSYTTSVTFTGDDGRLYKWGFAALDDRETILAVLMPTDYLAPIEQLARNLLIGSVAAALLAALLAVFLAGSVVRPLERLSRVAIRIQRGRMDEPVATEGGHEVGRLARAMERMRQGIQERDESLRLMLAQVAHEIRNPLGGVELLASAAADTDEPEERKRLIGRVREEVRGLNDIITEFLSFARPLTVPETPSDVRPEIREAAELVQVEIEERGGSLEVSLPDEPLLVRVSEGHVKRVALNLLRNAAQASDTVRLTADHAGPQVRITVADSGDGVPEAMRDRVFEPFVTDKEQGAGLGLAIVKKVAEATGGRAELVPPAETNGVGGAVFRVYFGNPEERRRHPRSDD